MADDSAAAVESAGAPAKKKSKLPVLIALVAVLGGGGFFAMKMRGGGAKAKVELGEVVQLNEILVNLKEPNTYARTDISLHLAKGFDKLKLEAKIDAVRDAIILNLSSKSLNQVRTLEGKLALKREIAASVNDLLGEPKNAAKKADPAKEGETPGAPEGKEKSAKPVHPDWESDSGPVLKVYFANFATQ